jgi:multiple sugar transport system substrate-binding protein
VNSKTRNLRVTAASFVTGMAVLVAGCAGPDSEGDANGDGATEIVFSYLWGGAEGEALAALIEDCNESQDEIIVKGVSSPDVQKQLTQMSSSNGAFDISDNFGYNTASLASKGVLEPLDEYIERDGYDLSDFVEPAMKQAEYEGKTYAIPLGVHTHQLMYNKTLFEEAGIDGPPETIEEWEEMIPRLTKVDADGNITQLGYGQPEPARSFVSLAFMNGGSFHGDEPGDAPQPDNDATRAALNFYYENIIEPYGAANVQTFLSGFGELYSPEHPFYRGKLAMYIDGANQVTTIEQLAPDLDYGVAPLPYPEDFPERAGTTEITNSTYFIPANSRHKDEAWEFMKYLLDNEPLGEFTKAISNLPARKSLADDPIYADLPEQYTVFADSLSSPNLRSIPSEPWTAEYRADLSTVLEGVNTGRTTPDEALAELEKRAQNYAG